MRTKVKKIRVNTREEKVDISVDGILKRKFLLRLLEVQAIVPSREVVELLQEAIARIKQLYDTLPRSYGVSEKKFSTVWGGVVDALEQNQISSTDPQTIKTLLCAHCELDSLHKIEKMLNRSAARP